MNNHKNKKNGMKLRLFEGLLALLFLFSFSSAVVVEPVFENTANTTFGTEHANSTDAIINISGGYIATLNLTANVQNLRWKAFVGNVNGKFTLDDASGNTIYDWPSEITTGKVYSTRTNSELNWAGIGCADLTDLENENVAMAHNGVGDNITATFRHESVSAFYAAGRTISGCSYSLKTYTNLTGGESDDFEEIVLHDGTNLIYTALFDKNAEAGFDGNNYDFQMLVPENGSQGFSGATAYYIYMELN
jgi:hypothetical protein